MRAGGFARLFARHERAIATERRLIGVSLLRIAVGAIRLPDPLGQWPDRHLIWGPDGIYPSWIFLREFGGSGGPNLLATDSRLLFEVSYHLMIAVSMLYLLGWRTIPVGVAFYIVAWSLL